MRLWQTIKTRFSSQPTNDSWAITEINQPTAEAIAAEQDFCRQYYALETEAAFELSLQQAAAGLRAAQYFVGLFFDSGNAGLQDASQARQYYYRAALQNSPEAQYNLATLLLMGRGGEQNLGLAFSWYQKAAENGIAQAQYNCGSMLDEGYGVKADKAQARHWYLAAAKQAYPQACQNLAALYCEGEGGDKSFEQSYAWAMLAAAAKVEGSDELLAHLTESMSHDDIIFAKQQGDEYFDLYALELRRQQSQGAMSFDPNATEVINTKLL